MSVPTIDVETRRRTLAVRQALSPAHRVADAVAATRAVGVLHATEPATVPLSLHARVDGLTRDDVDVALYRERTLVRQLAMRRTLFVFPRELLPAAWGSASARVLEAEGRRIAKDVVLAGLALDGAAWLDDAQRRIVAAVEASEDGLTAAEIRERLPDLAVKVAVSPGAVWNHGRLLTHLGLDATLVRGHNTQHWRVSRPRWTPMRRWLGEAPTPLEADAGWRALVRVWLARFGPGTETDLVWWLGATKGIVRTALAELDAVRVALEGCDEPGWLLPDDPLLEPDGRIAPEVEPWAALLPVLDPTVMGWKQRDVVVGPHAAALFDRNGNAGTTAWWDGRIVGCWTQDPDDPAAPVVVRLLEDVPAAGRAALRVEAERLTAWLAGERVGTVYPSPAMRVDPASLAYPVLRA
ncbi:winged helix DNA-binding domain-containing protein [Nocardioides sp. TRM66260-LWL]|uniref:winged helix DNA-binding domain-containing protein n=1 Tax=Nocardioides sp. TRM66260-LWL TaxID=2874478 RepID=UPI001CC7A357|nr:winged helix DNA-binding domain-containing protein [Nocardioides sp. TRM66260-LWL]MBZ5733048.1 winged helix DNA-binding domain-containing protein [Nocardioides sp. TRM66260-LWL]